MFCIITLINGNSWIKEYVFSDIFWLNDELKIIMMSIQLWDGSKIVPVQLWYMFK